MLLSNLESCLNQLRWADWEVLPPCGSPEHCMKRPLGDLSPSEPQVKGHQTPRGGKTSPPTSSVVCLILLGPMKAISYYTQHLPPPVLLTSLACFPSNGITQVSPVTKNCPLSRKEAAGDCFLPLEGWGAWGRCSSSMDARHPGAELQICTGCLVKFEFQINKEEFFSAYTFHTILGTYLY